LVLRSAANGADPVRRQFVERGVGGDVVVRVSLGRIIDIATYLALILLHDVLLFQALESPWKSGRLGRKDYIVNLQIIIPTS
jgi:hypothetical protein